MGKLADRPCGQLLSLWAHAENPHPFSVSAPMRPLGLEAQAMPDESKLVAERKELSCTQPEVARSSSGSTAPSTPSAHSTGPSRRQSFAGAASTSSRHGMCLRPYSAALASLRLSTSPLRPRSGKLPRRLRKQLQTEHARPESRRRRTSSMAKRPTSSSRAPQMLSCWSSGLADTAGLQAFSSDRLARSVRITLYVPWLSSAKAEKPGD